MKALMLAEYTFWFAIATLTILFVGWSAHGTGYVGKVILPNSYRSAPPIPISMILNVGTTQVCAPGYAKSVRNVPESVKRKICKPKTDCVVDHVISLELGGSNDISNLAAQTKVAGHQKDRLEDLLHEEVCKMGMPLAQAQEQLWGMWGHDEGKW